MPPVHVPVMQAVPVGQHGLPLKPHVTHIPFEQSVLDCVHALPGQHGERAFPQL